MHKRFYKEGLALDPHLLIREISAYREPSVARSLFELVITASTFIILWALMWFLWDAGYWIGLVLAVPAAGLLVRLFLIQHDCGHGSFFRRRAANDWVGRLIGVLTLTPYDFWRRSHALHHANSGNLDRRGIGDIETLTVQEFKAREAWPRFRYRLYRNPVVMFVFGPAYLFLLRHRLPVGLMRHGWEPWLSAMATNAGIMVMVTSLIWLVGLVPFLLVQLPITLIASTIGAGYSMSNTNSKVYFGHVINSGAFTRQRCTAVRIMLCRGSCDGLQPISVSITCIICQAEYPSTGCLKFCEIVLNSASLADSR
jgi:omega-6 fatty acid desaturase (delta-12 desaturase)